ncbi:MAG: hypothetical protein KDC38_16665 [Planctomycetes bacterium]|nr:hypothetical protein [Planctomycetota bacterium]
MKRKIAYLALLTVVAGLCGGCARTAPSPFLPLISSPDVTSLASSD